MHGIGDAVVALFWAAALGAGAVIGAVVFAIVALIDPSTSVWWLFAAMAGGAGAAGASLRNWTDLH